MKYDLIIIGCGGHARSVLDVLLSDYPDISACIVDENAVDGEMIFSLPVYKSMRPANEIFIAIGDNEKRFSHAKLIHDKDVRTIISSSAHIGKDAIVGKGVFIGNGAHLGPETKVGDYSIINTGSIVEHEVSIGKFCHIAPNVTISGRSRIGNNVFFGAGATVIDAVSICSNAIVGAGAVVVENIGEPGTYVGCPVRKIK